MSAYVCELICGRSLSYKKFNPSRRLTEVFGCITVGLAALGIFVISLVCHYHEYMYMYTSLIVWARPSRLTGAMVCMHATPRVPLIGSAGNDNVDDRLQLLYPYV